jgi:crossover junction endodeoxyribonuclease RuvC
MYVLGIDPSLTGTGYVLLDKKGEIKTQKTIVTKKNGDSALEELNRLILIIDQIELERVEIAVIEGLAFMARNTSSLVQLAGLNYLIRLKLKENKIPFTVVPPTVLKKFITGKGNSPKEMMLLETYKRYDESFPNNNVCDAYGLSRIGLALLKEDKKLTQFQKDVINKII